MKILILVLQVALVESLKEVSGYLGDNITLPSGADPSWNLSSIEWSILSNDTWIATYRKGVTNIERVKRYKGRLTFNTTSGDLMIHDLTTEDAMEYTVDLTNTKGENRGNKIKLIVRQRLQKPTINIARQERKKGDCLLKLHCSSADKDVNLTWHSKPPGVDVFTGNNPSYNTVNLIAFLNAKQDHVEFTCTSSRNAEKASSVFTPKCDDNEPLPAEKYAIVFFVGVILGCLFAVFITKNFCKGKSPNEMNGRTTNQPAYLPANATSPETSTPC